MTLAVGVLYSSLDLNIPLLMGDTKTMLCCALLPIVQWQRLVWESSMQVRSHIHLAAFLFTGRIPNNVLRDHGNWLTNYK